MLSELRQKFPALFAECRWIQCAVGWRGLIERASVELEALSRREGVPIEVLEIREKYGLLQISVVAATTRVDAAAEAIVGKAETESESTCELCGSVGTMREENGWFKVRCVACLYVGETRGGRLCQCLIERSRTQSQCLTSTTHLDPSVHPGCWRF
jgi:hypothetical protein